MGTDAARGKFRWLWNLGDDRAVRDVLASIGDGRVEVAVSYGGRATPGEHGRPFLIDEAL